MAQRVGRLQQENAKLREEIKRLKGALKDINHEIIQELPLKQKSKSPLSQDRKKSIRDEIETRCMYVMPNSSVLKKKVDNFVNSNKFDQPDALVASFGLDEEKNFLESTGKDKKDYEKEDFDSIDLNEGKNNTQEDPESPGFEYLPCQNIGKTEGKILKESFSSYYDESLSRTMNGKTVEDFSDQILGSTEKVELDINFSNENLKPSNEDFKIFNENSKLLNENSKVSDENLKIFEENSRFLNENTKNLNQNFAEKNYNEKTLISEIEALRRENSKLRLKLSSSNKRVFARNRSNSKVKSKSPLRKCKSRSNTPRDLSSRPVKRNVSNKSLIFDMNLTPRRARHCNTCDHLLSKGYSTKYCVKHGTAKLNSK